MIEGVNCFNLLIYKAKCDRDLSRSIDTDLNKYIDIDLLAIKEFLFLFCVPYRVITEADSKMIDIFLVGSSSELSISRGYFLTLILVDLWRPSLSSCFNGFRCQLVPMKVPLLSPRMSL